MDFIAGFLGLCSAVGPGTATEVAAPAYGRQAISFGNVISGVVTNNRPFDFGNIGIAATAGRAIYDAPSGGNLIVVMPHATPRLPQGGSTDRGDVGFITLLITALAAYADGAAYSGSFLVGATLGLVYDGFEVLGWSTSPPNPVAGVTVLPRGGQFLAVQASTLSAGAPLAMLRGLLHT